MHFIEACREQRRHLEEPRWISACGHNVAGTAIAEDGLVIDLSRMRSVHVDPERRSARAEGGARLRDLDHETQAFGLAAPVGVVSATGVAGITLHGGAAFFADLAGATSGMREPDLSVVDPIFKKHGLELLGPPLATRPPLAPDVRALRERAFA